MSSAQFLIGLVVLTLALALWAAIFATRGDFAARKAFKAWETSTKPQPNIVFTGRVSPSQAIELEVENLGGTPASSACRRTHRRGRSRSASWSRPGSARSNPNAWSSSART
jgi:hypothetical protein